MSAYLDCQLKFELRPLYLITKLPCEIQNWLELIFNSWKASFMSLKRSIIRRVWYCMGLAWPCWSIFCRILDILRAFFWCIFCALYYSKKFLKIDWWIFFKLFTVCNKCKSIFIYFVMSKNMDIVQCNGYETNKRLLTLHVVVGVGHKVIVFNLRDELFLSNRI